MVQPTSLIRIIPVSVSTLSLLAAFIALAGAASCAEKKSGPAATPRMDTEAAAPRRTIASYSDTSAAGSGARADTTSAPATGANGIAVATPHAETGPAWNRAELVSGVQQFVTAIDSNNQTAFWHSLSRRSIRLIDGGHLASHDQIWKDARETLSDIRERRITVIGGSRDSVALQIDGKRLIDGERESDPIIIQLLREQNQWKVVYPGLLYPEHDLRKGQ
ncbi:MAG TPA: hypothetical protein VHI13_08910 [Candidatus Kapabacteria bacterium]|nr:hypothetical protein [Candidatus Kapabacteria bacterium]